MGSNWPLKSLKELGVSLIDCVHKTPTAIDDGVPYIGIPQMKGGTIDFSANPRLISEGDYQLWTVKAKPTYGDIVLSRRCNPGETAYVPQGCKFALGQNLVLLRPDPAKIHPGYLRWVVKSPIWWEEVSKYKNPGAIFDSLKCADIPNFEVPEPNYAAQVLIDKCLLDLSDKIELNHQINQTLEQIAQNLFKSWFVDFDPVIDNALDADFFEQDLDFPDELLRRAEARKAACKSADFKPLPDDIRQLFPAAFEECAESTFGLGGWVPRGWAVMPLENVTSLIIDHRGKTPKKLGGDWSEKGHPAISAKNIKNGRLIRHDAIRCVDSDLYVKWMKDSLLASDILMTSEAPLGELLYLVKDSDYLLSQRLYGIRANKEIISGCYLYFWLQTKVAKADIDGRATGTTVVGIRQSELKKVNVMVPQKTVVDSFSNLAAHYLAKIESNEKQSTELESLRDILLPKLISGELRLDEFETGLAREKVA